jgi:hypothetical protein
MNARPATNVKPKSKRIRSPASPAKMGKTANRPLAKMAVRAESKAENRVVAQAARDHL